MPTTAQESGGLSIRWTGLGGTNNWFTADNWLPTIVPGALDEVTIMPELAQPLIFGTANCAILRIEPSAVVTVDGGTLNVSQLIELKYDNTAAEIGVLELDNRGRLNLAGVFESTHVGNLPQIDGTVALVGNTTITSTFTTFDNLEIGADVNVTVNGGAVNVKRDFFMATGATFTAAPVITLTGTGQMDTFDTAAPAVRIVSGTRSLTGSMDIAGNLDVEAGGTLELGNSHRLTVGGDAVFAGVVRNPARSGSARTTRVKCRSSIPSVIFVQDLP